MSDRYTFTTVCALDQLGGRHYIYTCDHHAGGGEYKNVITVEDTAYQVCCYPMEDKAEEIGEKLPCLKPADLQSYFTDYPTEAMCGVLEKTKVAGIPFAQLVMVVQYGIRGGIYEVESIHVTKDGVGQAWYHADDFAEDDTWRMMEHAVKDAWDCCQRKLGK